MIETVKRHRDWRRAVTPLGSGVRHVPSGVYFVLKPKRLLFGESPSPDDFAVTPINLGELEKVPHASEWDQLLIEARLMSCFYIGIIALTVVNAGTGREDEDVWLRAA